MPPISALPYPLSLTGTTRAPASVASCWLPSVLPLSATRTSPLMPLSARKPIALRTHVATVSASLRQGMTTVSSTFSSPSGLPIRPLWASPGRASYYGRRGTNERSRPHVQCQGCQPSTGGYGLRVMPEATSRAPSARRTWSVRSEASRSARLRSLAGRIWSGHRLFVIVLIPAVLLRADAELGYRWQAWFNDSFVYVEDTIHFNLDPTRVSGYSVWLKILEPLHSYAIVTILQHLMGLAVAIMVYALARHRFGAPRWIAALAALPVLADGYQIELEHLILSDVPFEFLIALATTLLLWDRKPSWQRAALIGLILGVAETVRSVA